MHKRLASVVLATFRTSTTEELRRSLERFSLHDWNDNFHWLDASGLALYFLDELKSRGIESAIPDSVFYQLERRQRQNVERTRSTFEEFARINSAFRRAGLRYVNLKGFTLAPDFCPDLSLRYQTDCDFLMGIPHAEKCHDILKALGYGLVAANGHVLEFKTDVGSTPRIEDLYKVRRERSVEIHLCDARRPDRHPGLLERARQLRIKGASYPALCRDDMFLSQTWHLFRHLRSEWVRVSWLLEFRHFVRLYSGDSAVWSAIQTRVASARDEQVAVGMVLHFAEAVLGSFAPDELTRWSLPPVPPHAALWAERYANRIALTDFPGSKLYLLLEQTILTGAPATDVRRRLFPTRVPAAVVVAPTNGITKRAQALLSRAAYFCFRLKFHLVSTSQYFWERWLWRREHRDLLGRSYAPGRCSAGIVD